MKKILTLAPTDPEAKREYFYIMKDTQIEATMDSEGICGDYIYLDCGRLMNFAKIAGSVEDEQILSLLDKTEDFAKLVHSIGVSVVTVNPEEEVEISFLSYGKEDRYHGGTKLNITIPGNGQEYIIPIAEQEWTDDEDVIGSLSFYFGKPGELATATVALYLNDGFHAPIINEDQDVDFTSAQYKEMILKSGVHVGNNGRFAKVVDKVLKGETITVAFIGGSITQGAGSKPISTKCYAYRTYLGFVDWIKELAKSQGFADDEIEERIHYVKAGIGGTDSELGLVRYERDILEEGQTQPDVVIIEYAVNDSSDELEGGCFESLLCKAWNGPGSPAIFLLFSVFVDDWNLQERLIPIGKAYNVPTVSVKDAVVEQFYDDSKRVVSKRQFFYDMYHPTNIGHQVMADCLLNGMKEAYHADKQEVNQVLIENVKPVYTAALENIRLIDKKSTDASCEICVGSFTETDDVLQCVERNLDSHQTPSFPYNWKKPYGSDNQPFKLRAKCRAVVIVGKDSGDTQFGKAEFFVDGKKTSELDPHINNWTHCMAKIVLLEEDEKEHLIEVKMANEDAEKSFAILGIGII